MNLDDLAKERATAHLRYRGLCNVARYITDAGIALVQLGLRNSDEARALREAFTAIARSREQYRSSAFGLKPETGSKTA